jgi:hypothetical protein
MGQSWAWAEARKVKDLRIGLDMLGSCLFACGYSQTPIYSRRSFSRAEKAMLSELQGSGRGVSGNSIYHA